MYGVKVRNFKVRAESECINVKSPNKCLVLRHTKFHSSVYQFLGQAQNCLDYPRIFSGLVGINMSCRVHNHNMHPNLMTLKMTLSIKFWRMYVCFSEDMNIQEVESKKNR